MANSITGINDDIISQAILEAFVAGITPLSAFSTNFSDDAARKGDKVSVLRSTGADAAATKTTASDYTIQDADSDAIEIALGQPEYVSWALDDVEVASSSVLNLEVYGKQKGFQLAKAVLQKTGKGVWTNITNANYGGAAFTGAATTFDSTDITSSTGIKDVCDDADMPLDQRSLILSPAYYNELIADTAVQPQYAIGGTEVIRSGMIPDLFGFKVFMSNLIPANGENLVGFVAHPAGMAVAMRYLQPQEGHKYSRADRVADESGITLGIRDWYDEDSGQRKRVMECVFGAAVGIAGGIKRMVSA